MKRIKDSVVMKSLLGLMILLVLYSVVVAFIGFRGFTNALLEQYADGAFRTARTAAADVDANRIEEYRGSGGVSEEYLRVWSRLDELCNTQDATFVYVIEPDRTDYGHITFLFSTIHAGSPYTYYEFGYVRETTNDDYKAKYRLLCEGRSERELVIRDKGYIETDAHITAMIPLKDDTGATAAILCVQRQMDALTTARKSFIAKVLAALVMIGFAAFVVQSLYLNRVFLYPVRTITDEANRFARENITVGKKLTERIRNTDEIGQLAESIDSMEDQIKSYVRNLTRITADSERMATELSLASRIQEDMLPNIYPAFPDRHEFDIHASMDPAREVGGDFYNFILVDDDHLALMIADVSGKGVPGALFMMASMILITNSVRMGRRPGEVLEYTNNVICARNREQMFITVWLGILEISTGRLTAANAGHEYPVLMRSGGKYELIKDKHGFVIGGMEDMKYREYELILRRGDKLFLYTDGVPEAVDTENRMFGTERMLSALNSDPDAAPRSTIRNVRREMDAFTGSAEQFDDITMLALSYFGPDAEE